MSKRQSWKIHIKTVFNLDRTEYRLGDLTKKIIHDVKKHLDKADDGSAALGDVAIEAQVGAVKKRTKAFKVEGQPQVEVGESLLLPAPSEREVLTLRIWRVNIGLLPDALVGETELGKGMEDGGEVAVYRQGKQAGSVWLNVVPVEGSFVPVAAEDDAEVKANPLDKANSVLLKLRNKLGNTDEFKSLTVLTRRPLLGRPASKESIGECTVIIEGVRGLANVVQEPFLVLGVDGQEFRAENLAHCSQADLTYKFQVSSMQDNLSIYCFDDLKSDRNRAVGRILVPLSCLLRKAGDMPGPGGLCSAICASNCIGTRLTAQFLPLLKDGLSAATGADRFRPAVKGQKNMGMLKSGVFGAVTLELQLVLNSRSNSQLKSYASSVFTGPCSVTAEQSRRSLGSSGEGSEPSLIDVLKSINIEKLIRNGNRLETICESEAQGLIRWLRAGGIRHAVLAGSFWIAFCMLGFFPPPNWAVPLYICAACIGNGYLVGKQREEDWQKLVTLKPPLLQESLNEPLLETAVTSASKGPQRKNAIIVWDDENAPETATETIANFKKTVTDIDRNLTTLVSFIERISNMFSFADAAATVMCQIVSVIAAGSLSLIFFLYSWCEIDPSGSKASAVIGFALIFAVALSSPPKKDDDPFVGLAQFNEALQCVPDQQELIHRYIATRIQVIEPGTMLA